MKADIDSHVLKGVAHSINEVETVVRRVNDTKLSRAFGKHKELLLRLIRGVEPHHRTGK